MRAAAAVKAAAAVRAAAAAAAAAPVRTVAVVAAAAAVVAGVAVAGVAGDVTAAADLYEQVSCLLFHRRAQLVKQAAHLLEQDPSVPALQGACCLPLGEGEGAALAFCQACVTVSWHLHVVETAASADFAEPAEVIGKGCLPSRLA